MKPAPYEIFKAVLRGIHGLFLITLLASLSILFVYFINKVVVPSAQVAFSAPSHTHQEEQKPHFPEYTNTRPHQERKTTETSEQPPQSDPLPTLFI